VAGHDFDVIAIMQRVQRLSNLRDAAPQSDAALANVAFAQRFVLGPENPGSHGDGAQEGNGNQQLALHAQALLLVAKCVQECSSADVRKRSINGMYANEGRNFGCWLEVCRRQQRIIRPSIATKIVPECRPMSFNRPRLSRRLI
jgi:hypothetical protein